MLMIVLAGAEGASQGLGCHFPIGWQEAALCFPPAQLPRGIKGTDLIWHHTVEGGELMKGPGSGTHVGPLEGKGGARW